VEFLFGDEDDLISALNKELRRLRFLLGEDG